MRLEFHKQIRSDIAHIMEYYEDVGGVELRTNSMPELGFLKILKTHLETSVRRFFLAQRRKENP